MKRLAVFAAALLVAATPASAASAGGHDALALGALIGLRSPVLTAHQRVHLALLLEDRAAFVPPGPIVVAADVATCRAGDVDVAAFGCVLTFGPRTVNLAGRPAHELYATIVEAGVPGDGAAGTIFEALHSLSCTLDPAKLAQKDGSGADCTFQPGPP
jgi:hypothetical protein